MLFEAVYLLKSHLTWKIDILYYGFKSIKMNLFLKKQKVFISHKRIDGGVSVDAVLLKRMLEKNQSLDIYMDIQEKSSGEFPSMINDEIRKSNSFIFLIPFDGDVSFLKEPDGWEYKEISDAIFKYEIMPIKSGRKSFQILPVTFSNSFEWPDDLPRDISKIRRFDIRKLNLNDRTEVIQKKLSRALYNKTHRSINWWVVAIISILVALIVLFCIRSIFNMQEYRMNENRVTFLKNKFQDKTASRIQPSFIIPVNERIPLVDSIYHFFELRDQFYDIVKTLPVINNSDIERNDDFTINVIKSVYFSYNSVYAPINELSSYSDGLVHFGSAIHNYNKQRNSIYSRFNHHDYAAIESQSKNIITWEKDLDSSMEKKLMLYLVKFNVFLNNFNSGLKHGNVRKAFNAEIPFTQNNEFWEVINWETTKFEETAKLCNMILGLL